MIGNDDERRQCVVRDPNTHGGCHELVLSQRACRRDAKYRPPRRDLLELLERRLRIEADVAPRRRRTRSVWYQARMIGARWCTGNSSSRASRRLPRFRTTRPPAARALCTQSDSSPIIATRYFPPATSTHVTGTQRSTPDFRPLTSSGR